MLTIIFYGRILILLHSAAGVACALLKVKESDRK